MRGIGAILHLLALLILGIELFLYLVGGLSSLASFLVQGPDADLSSCKCRDSTTCIHRSSCGAQLRQTAKSKSHLELYFRTLSSTHIIVVHIPASAEPRLARGENCHFSLEHHGIVGHSSRTNPCSRGVSITLT